MEDRVTYRAGIALLVATDKSANKQVENNSFMMTSAARAGKRRVRGCAKSRQRPVAK